MNYLPVTNPDDLYLPFIEKLYDEAFPAEERRDWEQLLMMIGRTDDMFLQVITSRGNAVGFIIFWTFNDWCFIEHLAIDPQHRGMKYGESTMRHFMDKTKVLLEVEPPVSKDAIRRISFYERLGMALIPFVYSQPSYREAHVFYEMELMSNGPENDMEQFDAIIFIILQRVYGFSIASRE